MIDWYDAHMIERFWDKVKRCAHQWPCQRVLLAMARGKK